MRMMARVPAAAAHMAYVHIIDTGIYISHSLDTPDYQYAYVFEWNL